jgi:hypothetical protein
MVDLRAAAKRAMARLEVAKNRNRAFGNEPGEDVTLACERGAPMSRSIPTLIPAAAAIALVASVAGAPGASAFANAAAASGVPALLSCSGSRLVRPAGTVVLSCADANTEISRTHWRTWKGRSATGTTDFGVNLCTPTCVASRMRFFPGSVVRLLGAERTHHGLVFSRAEIGYVLGGKHRTFTAYPAT